MSLLPLLLKAWPALLGIGGFLVFRSAYRWYCDLMDIK